MAPQQLTANDGSILTSEDGTMITAPEGSIIAADGSILAADGTMLAPPGSVITSEPQQHMEVQPTQQQLQQQHEQQLQLQQEHQQQLQQEQQLQEQQLQQQEQQLLQQQHQQQQQNLIGLQLPEESGEVLYLDPNDPAAQLLLQEAGITLGEGGVLQTADGQILHSEDGHPITTNAKPAPKPTNNLMGAAMGAAGLSEDLGFQLPTGVKADTSAIDIPLSQQTSNLQPNLPVSQSYSQAVSEDPAQAARHIFQPRFATQSAIPQQQQPLAPAAPQSGQKYQKLTFNSGANYSSAQPPAPAPIQKKTVAQKQNKRTVPSTDMQIGPDQQKVTYTVTSENGYSQTYMMICSKTLDQNTLINTLIKNISNDPNHKGKKTIKITQHKYGAKKSAKAGQQQQQQGGRVVQGPRQQLVPSSTVQQGRQVQQQQQRRVQPAAARAQARPLPQGQHVQQRQQQQLQPARQQLQQVQQQQQPAPQASQPPRQILQSEPDIGPEPVSSQQEIGRAHV